MLNVPPKVPKVDSLSPEKKFAIVPIASTMKPLISPNKPNMVRIGFKNIDMASPCIFVIHCTKLPIESCPNCSAKGIIIGLHLYSGQFSLICFIPTEKALNIYNAINTEIIITTFNISLNFILKYIVILFMKLTTFF